MKFEMNNSDWFLVSCLSDLRSRHLFGLNLNTIEMICTVLFCVCLMWLHSLLTINSCWRRDTRLQFVNANIQASLYTISVCLRLYIDHSFVIWCQYQHPPYPNGMKNLAQLKQTIQWLEENDEHLKQRTVWMHS